MRRVQNCTNRWKQLFALLLCLVMMVSAGWTGASAETEGSPEIPEPPESDLLADVETSDDWDEMFADLNLSGNWAEDLLAVAESQMGYKQSRRNFEAVYNEEKNSYDLYGWSRYGAWYKEPYAEWSTLFVCFCLSYAGIPSEVIPYDSEAASWADKLSELGLFQTAEDYTPKPGDLMFTDWDDDGKIDHVGIVREVNEEYDEIVTIEGDSNSGVDLYGYDALDSIIAGFVTLPEKPDGLAAVEQHIRGDNGRGDVPSPDQTSETTAGDEEAVLTDAAFAENADASDIPDPPESDLLADVETTEDWDEMFAGMELSGNWAEDLVNVAKSQLGYTESIRNFEAIYADDRNAYDLYGWTRYGAWYGEPYGEWNAMFVSFCLFYAGVSSDAVPYDSDPARWADTLRTRELFRELEEDYTPEPGDLIFFDRDGDGRADRVGVVSEVDPETGALNTVEGGRSGRVDAYGYAADTGYILGFAALPENPQGEADQTSGQGSGRTPAVQPDKKTADDEEFVLVAGFAGNESGVTIYIEAGEGSVPPDTMWTLSPINGNQIKTLVNSAADGEVLETRAFHVLLHDPFGNTVDPQKPMRFRLYPTSWNYTADHILVLQILEDNTVNIVARADDFREIATSGIRFEAQYNGIYAVVNVA